MLRGGAIHRLLPRPGAPGALAQPAHAQEHLDQPVLLERADAPAGGALDHFRGIRDAFGKIGASIYAFNYSFGNDFSDDEIDRGFEMARALGSEVITASTNLTVAKRVAPFAESAEIGHAVNRVKWGVWGIDDLRALYAPLPDVRRRYPHLQLTGPAMLDFEYAALFSALREWPRAAPLAALSHCLYVDRRGAPENPQHGFGSPEKFALGRAMARAAAGTERFVVSEVNWPLRGQGAHAPIHAPYFPPWRAAGDTGVTEEEYGAFLLRYLCLALGSGMVERVYWWRLAARGYGLVDDTDPSALRPRAAYAMLRRFLALLGESTFVGAQLPAAEGERHGRYRFEFRRADGERVALAYAHGPALEGPAHAEDALGRPLPGGTPLGGTPVYERGARA